MVKFQGKNWQSGVSRNASFFFACLDVAGHALYSKKYGVTTLKHLILVKNGRQMFSFNNLENHREYNQSLEKVCLSYEKLKKLETVYHRFGSNLLEASKRLEKNLTLYAFQNFIISFQQLAAGLFLTTSIGRHTLELLIKELKKAYPKLPPEELDILMGNITYPKKHTPLVESQVSLLKIGSELQKQKLGVNEIKAHPDIYKKFKNHVKRYSFIPANINEEPWSEEQILGQLKNLIKLDCSKEIKNIFKQHKERIKHARQARNRIKDKKIRLIARSLQIGTLLNEYRKYIFCRANLAYRPLFKEIAKKYKLSDWRECWKFTPEEIIKLYFKGNKKVLNVLPKRNWAGVVFAKNKNGYRLLNNQELKLFIKEIESIVPEEKKASAVKEIKGMIANPGVIRGTVRVILGRVDFGKFRDGDIIVATMTSVDFTPLMKRASAFITNEGGITSHAAIVSRELNKPCIIGTKIATKVLRDGQLVEVDANKGIVRIIK